MRSTARLKRGLAFGLCLWAVATAIVLSPAAAAAAEQPQRVPRFRPHDPRQVVVRQRLRDLSALGVRAPVREAPRSARPVVRTPGVASGAARNGAPVPLFAPLGGGAAGPTAAALSARATPRLWSVLGRVLDFGGGAVPGAGVYMDVYDSDDPVWWGSAESDAAGRFIFSGSPEGHAGISVELPAGRGATGYHAWGIPLYDGSNRLVDFQPGLVPFSTTRTAADGWDHWDTVEVQTWGSLGGADALAGRSGSAYAMPPDYGYACVYYFTNQGVEWNQDSPYSYPLEAGGRGGTAIRVDQDDAQSVLVLSRWASGRPGSTIRLGLGGWPYGYLADIYGYSEDPDDRVLYDYTDFDSPGDSWGYAVSMPIPRGVKPGYAFVIQAARADQDSGLVVRDYFQVCTLNASRSGIRRGGAVRLSGVIPTQGHWGSLAGYRKTVTVYARTSSGGQPSTWRPGKGWKKVCTCKANGYGKYVSRKLRPQRNTWYVVRYPGDDWYWGGYTSVVKVRVR